MESIVGSVVECSPATRAARVRFPDDAKYIFGLNFGIFIFGIFRIFFQIFFFENVLSGNLQSRSADRELI
jgi:hypothetical protein